MTSKKNRHALVSSIISLILCCSMLLGTTFAWFTDEVTSTGNIIKSGTLEVKMSWSNTEDGEYKDASEGAIFGYKFWEPGYVDIKYIKLENVGNLAFKYQLTVDPSDSTAEGNKLAEVIDVYAAIVKDDFVAPTRETVEDMTKMGTLNTLIGENLADDGVLLPKEGSENVQLAPDAESYEGEVTVCLALKMQEEAGNEYQDLSVGDGFSVKLLAAQYTWENDSFNNQYDKGAAWNGVVPTEMPDTLVLEYADNPQNGGKITIKDADAFVYLNNLVEYFKANATQNPYNHYYYNMKWSVELDADINLMNIPVDTINLGFFGGGFDGKGHTISNVVVKDGQPALFDYSVNTFKNLTVQNIVVNAPGVTRVAAVANKGALTNVHVVNANVIGGKSVGGLVGQGSNFSNCSVKDSTVTGTDKTVGGLVGYCIGDPNHANATGNVVENVKVTGAYNVGGMFGQAQNVTVEDNTVKNVTVTSTTALPANASANEVRSAEVAARSAFDTTTIGANTVEDVTIVANVSTAAEMQATLAAGGEVILTEDLDLKDAPIAVAAGTQAVIDLNGKKLSGLSTSSTTSNLIKVAQGGELTLKNGTVSFAATTPDTNWGGEGQPDFPGYANNTISNAGKLVIDGATIENLTAAGGASYAIDCYPGSDLVINSGIVKGYDKIAIRMFANSNTVDTKLTINGGDISGRRGIWVQIPGSDASKAMMATLEINGGTITALDEDDCAIYSYSYGNSFANTNITITGGTFNGDVAFGGGYKGDTENVTITGGTFNGELGRYLANDGWEDIAKP